jgi:hypothetical protein
MQLASLMRVHHSSWTLIAQYGTVLSLGIDLDLRLVISIMTML